MRRMSLRETSIVAAAPGGGVLSPAGRTALSRLALAAGLWCAALLLLTFAAAVRVGSIDPAVARAGGLAGRALSLAGFGALAVAAGAVLLVVVEGIGRLLAPLGRFRGARTGPALGAPRSEALLAVVAAPLILGVSWFGFRWIAIPLSFTGVGAIEVPLLSPAAGGLLLPVAGGLVAELLLAVGWLALGRRHRWWTLRALLGLYWVAVLAVVVGGPNLLAGDPLEWAERIGSATIPQGWLATAPRAPGSWWPAVQAGLAAALVVTLFGVLREVREAWRAYRAERARGPR
jgi:hypothetical protein